MFYLFLLYLFVGDSVGFLASSDVEVRCAKETVRIGVTWLWVRTRHDVVMGLRVSCCVVFYFGFWLFMNLSMTMGCFLFWFLIVYESERDLAFFPAPASALEWRVRRRDDGAALLWIKTKEKFSFLFFFLFKFFVKNLFYARVVWLF